VSQARFYTFSPILKFEANDRWMAQPMKLPAGGWTPRRFLIESSAAREVGSLHGHRVIEWTLDGKRQLVAPDLNLFALLIEDKHGRKSYSNVQIGEPQSDLFEPPPDAPVDFLDKPGGIVIIK
jgi:hypothetical protein